MPTGTRTNMKSTWCAKLRNSYTCRTAPSSARAMKWNWNGRADYIRAVMGATVLHKKHRAALSAERARCVGFVSLWQNRSDIIDDSQCSRDHHLMSRELSCTLNSKLFQNAATAAIRRKHRVRLPHVDKKAPRSLR